MKTVDKKLAARIDLVMNLAREQAAKEDKANGTHTVSNHIEEFSLHFHGYGEPGYDVGKSGIICTGNFNTITQCDNIAKENRMVSNLPERLSHILEKLGVELAWCDEWRACDDCGVLLRIQPNSHWWTPSYHDDGGEGAEFVCLKCDNDAQEAAQCVDEEDMWATSWDSSPDADEPTSPDDVREVLSKPAQ